MATDDEPMTPHLKRLRTFPVDEPQMRRRRLDGNVGTESCDANACFSDAASGSGAGAGDVDATAAQRSPAAVRIANFRASWPFYQWLCVAVCWWLLVGIVGFGASWASRESRVAPEDAELQAKLACWASPDTRSGIVKEYFSSDASMSTLLASDTDGEVLCYLAGERHELPQRLADLTPWELLHLQYRLRTLDRAPVGAWAYRKLHRMHAESTYIGLVEFPRATLFQLQLFESKTTLAFLENRTARMTLNRWNPPAGGIKFALLSILCPQVLIIAHAIPFFSVSYWTMYVLVLVSMQSLLAQWWFPTEVFLRRRRITWRQILETFWSHCRRYLAFIAYWYVVWPLIPWFLCDLMTYRTMVVWCLHSITTPFFHVLRREYLRAALFAVLPALLLMFDENRIRDTIIYLLGTGIGLFCLVCFRQDMSRMTPQEIEEAFGPLVSMLGSIKQVVTIPEANFLHASVSALNGLKPEQLQSDFPIAIRYKDELSQLQQEGIDAGGMYRDWLCRLADDFLSNEVGLFATFTVNGEEFLKLKPVDEVPAPHTSGNNVSQIEYAKCAGLLLALSLKAQISLGWALSEPLARLLLFADLPILLQGRPSLTGRRSVELDTWLCSLGFDSKTWIWAAVGDGEAKWYLDCIDVTKPLEERQALFEAGVEAIGLDADASLNNLADHMRDRVKWELIQSVAAPLQAFWEGFQSVPAARLPSTGGSRGRLVLQAQPKEWYVLAEHALGSPEVNLEDWRLHTRTVGNVGLSSQVVYWFWRYAQSLNLAERQQLLFWWTAYRRPPHKGFQAMPRLTLNICSTSERLPVAHTCFYTIDLPAYESFEVLREKVDVAMRNTSFALS